MGGLTRTVHPQANFFWKPLAEVAPDLNVGDVNPDDPPMALLMLNPDQEQHLYVFNEEGRKKLVEALTGGVMLPAGVKLQ